MYTKHPREFYRLVFVLMAIGIAVAAVGHLAGCIEPYTPPQGITDGELEVEETSRS